MQHFDWVPSIGDPTLGGWITVALYAVATIGAWLTARHVRDNARERRIWRAIAVLFLVLGINKQLDLQTALTEIGRALALSEGWYKQRQLVQVDFIVAVALACAVGAATLLVWARRAPPATWLALGGVILVIGFVLIRAASFHHIDRFIRSAVFGMRWNWILEMGGIGVVIMASHWRRLTR
jgi:hypothetical protein